MSFIWPLRRGEGAAPDASNIKNISKWRCLSRSSGQILPLHHSERAADSPALQEQGFYACLEGGAGREGLVLCIRWDLKKPLNKLPVLGGFLEDVEAALEGENVRLPISLFHKIL